MKLVVATYGTEGDARPFAALCRALIDAGHEARLLADAATLGGALTLAVPTTALAGDIRGSLNNQGRSGDVSRGRGVNATAGVLAKLAHENTESWLRTIIDAAQGCDAIVAAGLASYTAISAAEYRAIPAIGAGMIPIVPTAAFASPFVSSTWVPRQLNRASHGFVNAILWRAFRDKTNAARARFKLPARKTVWTGIPMMYGVSPNLLSTPADWPANVHLCGQWLAPSPAWTPPPELASFLAAGEAPIYIGFGSMTGFDPSQLLHGLVTAIRGRRALFHLGWSGVDPKALPNNFLAIDDTPHDWLFPRVAAVIHHGGSGTSHSAARAGRPSIVAPFAGDQPFWAERLRRAGVAPPAVDARRPKAAAFANALDFVATARVQHRARALGERMRAENGVVNAVAILERIVGGRGRD